MREIVLDTETTGLDPGDGHRVVEIGCVEIVNLVPSGRVWQQYVNPERSMPADAAAVHGLTDTFLADKPTFADIVDGFLDFLGEAPLVIHNAAFDMRFLNSELARLDRPPLAAARAVDTVQMARARFFGAPVNLDALCKRFAIDNSDRTLHGALKDAHLLAAVYLELRGGRQPGLTLQAGRREAALTVHRARTPRVIAPSADEAAAHAAFLDRLASPLWRRDA